LLKKLEIKNKKDDELPADCKDLVIRVKEKLSRLEASNKAEIEKIDFIAECHRLIESGNKEDLDGLVDIGGYW
jgi:predicted metal-binding protein